MAIEEGEEHGGIDEEGLEEAGGAYGGDDGGDSAEFSFPSSAALETGQEEQVNEESYAASTDLFDEEMMLDSSNPYAFADMAEAMLLPPPPPPPPSQPSGNPHQGDEDETDWNFWLWDHDRR